jgi:hypothetical protein
MRSQLTTRICGNYRARIAAVWSGQNQRFPHSSYIERRMAEAQAKPAHRAAKCDPAPFRDALASEPFSRPSHKLPI